MSTSFNLRYKVFRDFKYLVDQSTKKIEWL